MRKREVCSDKGFTLIELLIAVTILSIVITVVVEAFWLAQRSMEKGSEVMDVELRERVAVDLISKQLSSAFPFPLKENGPGFVGDVQRIDFITTLPMALERRAGLFHVSYVLEDPPAGGAGELKMLKVYQRPFYTPKNPPYGGGELGGFTVLAAIEDASWAYYADGLWSDEYAGETGRLPERIRLTLTYRSDASEEREQIIEIVIPVIADPG